MFISQSPNKLSNCIMNICVYSVKPFRVNPTASFSHLTTKDPIKHDAYNTKSFLKKSEFS